ncbi:MULTISPECIES: NAD(P)/FAD-dependent oxidoreductase [unclassified Kitasatospora]|uniref:NAD(P)/FAD-dependent oxidoreductase n=1 Tax=unclassified Kitasatospora TaxID=2633591 RepID=UPI003809096F
MTTAAAPTESRTARRYDTDPYAGPYADPDTDPYADLYDGPYAERYGTDRYDAVVAGGGPAGAAAALTLARAGRTVLLADAGGGPSKTGESLVPAARLLLHDLGVDIRSLDADHRPCRATLSAWGSPHLHRTDFITDPYGHGWHLDRPAFDRLLRAAVRTHRADVAERATVTHPAPHPGGGWQVTVRADGAARPVRCRWLVDATGRRASLATRCGARRHRYDRLIAVHLRLTAGPADSEGASLVESAPDGWWYTAPHTPAHRLVTYFTDTDLAPPGLGHPGAFLDRLAATRHTARLAVGRSPLAGASPRRCAAHTARLEPLAGEGWIAAGDAAIAFDPLSSQGILTALYSGLCAGQAIDARLRGEAGALDGYAARLGETFDAYRYGHRQIHIGEERWHSRPFWQRRRSPGGPGSLAQFI